MRTFLPFSRVLSGVTLSALIAIPIAPAAAAGVPMASPAASCTVTTADAVWGFKESFRSYISGTIANGGWEVDGGAAYETPNFTWTGGVGWYDLATQTGEVAFTGGIHFTGHDGLLDTTVQDPTLVFGGPGVAQVRLDISGVSMEDAMTGGGEAQTVEQVPLVDVDLATATIAAASDVVTVTVVAAPTSITAEGFAAFGNYESGTAFDPIALAVTATCSPSETPAPSPTGASETAVDSTPSDSAVAATSAIPGWVPWGVGGLLIASAVIGGVLLARRRRRAGGGQDSGGAA